MITIPTLQHMVADAIYDNPNMLSPNADTLEALSAKL